MKNDLLTIGNFTVHGYGLMIGIGFIAAYLMTEYRAKKHQMNTDFVFTLFLTSVVFGMLGAKLLFYMTMIDEIIANPKVILDEAEGFVVYGGIIGGILAGYVACRIKKQNFWKYFDLVMPAVALAQGFGRIGCLLAGCCYGMETSCKFSITFQNSDFAPNHVALIPTQIYSSILDFLHCIVLCMIAKKVKKDKIVSGCYLIFYSIGRFVLEFFRGDLIRGSVGVLSTSQFISIFICAAGIALVIWGNRSKEMNTELSEEIEDTAKGVSEE
ncbi:prolipoprotein diacylglyceryl transferase [Coprococcus sp. AF21-14LB]|uniref:prolipoprotein diacylglyceryl transferase n=1 Tax=Coprococcus sp. AF21-14LB TaxID=2292231 RepID=UPI000E4AF81B|nr:prolipoprotein diacylglyceryl transferase [Coprococcus sp. AF21-14LB]RGS82658.1 prolipoprotein diacylglyceryl transferase [Coprococcus sp. AF21-14LB]